MKSFGDEIVALDYKSGTIKDLIRRYRKTKKNRIKNKTFKKLLPLCIKEKQVIKLGEIVLMSYDVYQTTMDRIEELENKTKESSHN